VIVTIGKTHFTIQDVEEITADCFIAFWKNSSSFEMKSENLKSYLATIARNDAKNILISRKIEYLPLKDDALADDSNIEDNYTKREAEKCIKNCVFDLTEPDRSIFILRYFYFFKTYEIAKKLSINQKTVETRNSL
jgi:RNA polymerase sigma-70 factor (ECF subfamily)